MSALSLPWLPERLPGGYACQKSRIVENVVVILGQPRSSAEPARLFIRELGKEKVDPVEMGERDEVLDFDHLFTAGGVFALVARRTEDSKFPTGVGWDHHRLSRLDLRRRTLQALYEPSEDWQAAREAFPAALLGCSKDGLRVAVACGELAPGESGGLRYRIGFVDPSTGELELSEHLRGLFF